MPDDARIPGHPRGRPVTFHLDGAPVRAYEGETLAGALLAAGVPVLSRSIKYHRPRGLFCGRGECGSCLMRVDGKPNARACQVPVRDGLRAESQNAFPSARRDLFALSDKVWRRHFDHHSAFLRPRFMVPLYNWVIRRMAGFGRVPDLRAQPGGAPRPRVRPIRLVRADVVVAGAGAAGLAAAAEAAAAGRRVLVLEAGPEPGGALLDFDEDGAGRAEAERLVAEIRKQGGEVRTSTPVVGRYPEGELLALGPEGLLEARPRALVVATGSSDVPPLFPGNDLPGVMSARCALGLVRQGVRPGRAAALAGAAAEAGLVARALSRAGVEVAVEAAEVAEARGSSRVDEVVLADGRRVDVDLVVAFGRSPRGELAQQAGCRLRWDGAALVPELDAAGRTSAAGVWACGEATGAKDARAAAEEGRRVGAALAKEAAP